MTFAVANNSVLSPTLALGQYEYRSRPRRIEDEVALKVVERDGILFKSIFESSVAANLELLQIPFLFAKQKFSITINGKEYVYTPDFDLGIAYEGKPVLIEVHGARYITESFLDKMYEFMQTDAAKVRHIVLMTNRRPGKPNRLKIALEDYGYKEDDICDSVLYIPYAPELHQPLSLRNEKEKSLVGFLQDLKEHSRPIGLSIYGDALRH